MRTATRFPLERLAALDQAIRADRYPNASTMAKTLEVSPRTVQRDIEFFRDRLKAPIVFDAKRNGYIYSDPGYRLPSVAITEGELIAIFVAESALRQYRGTPFGPDLERAFSKIQLALTDRISVDLSRLSESYSFHATAPASCDPDLFRSLASAVVARRRLILDYRSASRGERTRREVDPFHLASVGGQWYLVAHCHERDDIRLFVPSRIERIETLDQTFDVPADFNIADYLGHDFSVFRGEPGEAHAIRIRFGGAIARLVAERTWHASQTVEWTPEGDLVIGLTLSHLREVERWVLSWGADAEVLQPMELRISVAGHAQQASRFYNTS